MIIPNIWENKIDVPNHQPVIYCPIKAASCGNDILHSAHHPRAQFSFHHSWFLNLSHKNIGDEPDYTYLVGGWATPLKNMTSSVGMIRNPILMETYISDVPNHKPDICIYIYINTHILSQLYGLMW